MIITYDRNKNLRNIAERGLSFDLVAEFDFMSALFEADERPNYNEPRVRSLGKIRDRLHVLAMKPKLNPELVDDDNPEWTEADFQRAVPFAQLPLAMQEKLVGGKHEIAPEPDKDGLVPVPLAAEVVARFRAGGPGWEGRINAALAEWLSMHAPADAPLPEADPG